MLAFMRRLFVGSWLGRILAMLIFLSFAAWGMGGFFSDLIGLGGSGVGNGNVATVDGHQITGQEFDQLYRHGLASAQAHQGAAASTPLPYAQRRQIAATVLQQLEVQAVIADAAHRIGVVVPDSVVRQQIMGLKGFLGPDGQFNRDMFEQRLAAAGLTEDQVVAQFRAQTAALGLIEPIRVGGHAPALLVRRAFAFDAEQRVLDLIALPFAAIPVPPAPDEATLQRFYDNDRARFAAPETRRIKLVLLSPDTIARDLVVPDAEERAAYQTMINRYQVPEKRSVQVLILPNTPDGAAQAARAATEWRSGSGWNQLTAATPGATPVSLDDATETSIPSPDLAKLVFAATPATVTGPVPTGAGLVVFEVGHVTPAQDRSFAEVQPELHQLLARQKAQALLAARVPKLQDAIAGGGLDQIPSDIGAVPALGTLDAQGLTPSGDPAPLPGTDDQRKAILARAFSVPAHQPPILVAAPDHGWFALTVEAITPAQPLSFVQAAEKVRAAWQLQQVRHADEQQAASLYAAAQAQGGLAHVAAGRPGLIEGATVRRGPTAGPVPPNLAQLAFSLSPGTSTMLETPTGFVVATLTAIRKADPAADSLGYSRMRDALDQQIADDLESSYTGALLQRGEPKSDDKALDAEVGPPEAGTSSSDGGA